MNEKFWKYMREANRYIDNEYKKEIAYIRDEVLGYGTLMLYK